MADTNEAGTPQTVVPGTESGGTGAKVGDGSESAAKPIDAGLQESWRLKTEVERVNRLEAENNARAQRIADLEARMYQVQAPVNPMAATIAQLQEEAAWNPSAAATLQSLAMTATQQAEFGLLNDAVRSDVPKKHWDVAMNLVRQSGYRMGFAQAAQLAQGAEAPALHEQLISKDDEIRRLREALDGKTVGSSNGKVQMSTPPAAVADGGAMEMDVDEYNAIMRQGGAAAIALRDKGVKFSRPKGL